MTEALAIDQELSKHDHNTAQDTFLNQEETGRLTTSVDSNGTLEEYHFLRHPLFKGKAIVDMAFGKIPNLVPLYDHLFDVLSPLSGQSLTALSFLPALRAFDLSDSEEIAKFMDNPETNHVIAQNEQIKIVLIRWEPGTECSIHGHSDGGCIFKVLHGEVDEKRYAANSEKRVLAETTYKKDGIAYIDDHIGLHSVGNPTSTPAITLHMYTPGNYKPKKY